ncbi:16S rRNA (cytosine(967)-C(5))-methyltransferase RsmB [Thiolapillus sp.]|uniref:16S rRNA (cytosine(967)-C(5))-methyltransferase RsmB n=1 Tax=Thiolapillus sp. TaxID=2017437 RepID=UPI003AF8B6DF
MAKPPTDPYRRKSGKTGSGNSGAFLRSRAALVLASVFNGQSLTEALSEYQQQVEERDRGLLAELAYGVCRDYFLLQAVASRLFRHSPKQKDQDIRALVLSGLYQLLSTRIPTHAAIGESAGAAKVLKKKWAVALVNGVLRRFQREREQILEQVTAENSSEVRYNQPTWLVDALFRAWRDQAEDVLKGLQQRPPFILRVNLQRYSLSEYVSLLTGEGLLSRPVAGVASALMLEKPVAVSRLPGFAEGAVSVQDAGAQMGAFLLDARPGMKVLDACAAPGGKTGHLLEHTPALDLTAMDVDEKRLQRVEENMQRLGFSPELVVGDASDPQGVWSEGGYDRILVDAPCTATGVIRRHPDIKLLRRPADVDALVQRQKAILAAQWSLLRPGGRMLYATCSLLPQENDEQISGFLLKHGDARAVMLASRRGIRTLHGLQLLPDMLETDGFYYALLEKQEV